MNAVNMKESRTWTQISRYIQEHQIFVVKMMKDFKKLKMYVSESVTDYIITMK